MYACKKQLCDVNTYYIVVQKYECNVHNIMSHDGMYIDDIDAVPSSLMKAPLPIL